jgi:hypothetical protein
MVLLGDLGTTKAPTPDKEIEAKKINSEFIVGQRICFGSESVRWPSIYFFVEMVDDFNRKLVIPVRHVVPSRKILSNFNFTV